jgi:hypothetical protein
VGLQTGQLLWQEVLVSLHCPLILPFLLQTAAPVALWAVPGVPRAVSAKEHLTSVLAAPDW